MRWIVRAGAVDLSGRLDPDKTTVVMDQYLPDDVATHWNAMISALTPGTRWTIELNTGDSQLSIVLRSEVEMRAAVPEDFTTTAVGDTELGSSYTQTMFIVVPRSSLTISSDGIAIPDDFL